MTEIVYPTHVRTYSLELLEQKESKGKSYTKTPKTEVILINAMCPLSNKSICTVYISLNLLVVYFLDFAYIQWDCYSLQMCIKINKELENSLVLPCCCHLIHVLALESWKKTNPALHFQRKLSKKDTLTSWGRPVGEVWSCGLWALLCHCHLRGCGQVSSSLCDLDSPSN